jgi:hypothetical protein
VSSISPRLPEAGSRGLQQGGLVMFENLFRIGFMLALLLPSLAVLGGLVLMIVPRSRSTAGIRQAAVHP